MVSGADPGEPGGQVTLDAERGVVYEGEIRDRERELEGRYPLEQGGGRQA
jgi:hypothetical protein